MFQRTLRYYLIVCADVKSKAVLVPQVGICYSNVFYFIHTILWEVLVRMAEYLNFTHIRMVYHTYYFYWQ